MKNFMAVLPTEYRESSQKYYDDFSLVYESRRRNRYHRFLDEFTAATLAPYAQDARLLEVGCGTGLILQQMSRYTHRLTGIDLSAGMVTIARAKGFEVIQSAADELPFANETFDLVCCFRVYSHISSHEAALAEMLRVTRPGGRVALDFYNRNSLRYLLKRLLGRRGLFRSHRADVYVRYDTADSVLGLAGQRARLVRARGFRIVLPAAFLLEVPVLGPLLARFEDYLADTFLQAVAGFRLLVLEKIK